MQAAIEAKRAKTHAAFAERERGGGCGPGVARRRRRVCSVVPRGERQRRGEAWERVRERRGGRMASPGGSRKQAGRQEEVEERGGRECARRRHVGVLLAQGGG